MKKIKKNWIQIAQKISNNGRQVLAKNSILQSSSVSVSSTPTVGNLGDAITIRNSVNPADFNSDTGYGKINAYREENNTLVLVKENVGKVNYERGIVIIDPGVLTGEFTLSIRPKKISFVSKQELLSNFEFAVTVKKESIN